MSSSTRLHCLSFSICPILLFFSLKAVFLLVSLGLQQVFEAEEINDNSFTESAEKVESIYNDSVGNISGQFGDEDGKGIKKGEESFYNGDEEFWWYDMKLKEGLSAENIQSVSYSETSETSGTSLFVKGQNATMKVISVGNNNKVNSADCIVTKGKIRISYLFLMTHKSNSGDNMIFDVELTDGMTIKAQLNVGGTKEELEFDKAESYEGKGILSPNGELSYTFSMPAEVKELVMIAELRSFLRMVWKMVIILQEKDIAKIMMVWRHMDLQSSMMVFRDFYYIFLQQLMTTDIITINLFMVFTPLTGGLLGKN